MKNWIPVARKNVGTTRRKGKTAKCKGKQDRGVRDRERRGKSKELDRRGCRGAGLRPDWPYLDAPAAFGALSSPTPRTLTLTLNSRGWMEGGPAHFSRPTWLHVLIGCRPLTLTSLPSAAPDTDGVDDLPSTWALLPKKKRRNGRGHPGEMLIVYVYSHIIHQPANMLSNKSLRSSFNNSEPFLL